MLHAAERGIDDFDGLLPVSCRPVFRERQQRLVRLPAVTYTYPLEDLTTAAATGDLLPKIKIGHPGDPEAMFARDCVRLREIHAALAGASAAYSNSGKLLYYLDANGRYESPEWILRLLDFLDRIGMLEQVLLIEEPFPEEEDFEVEDLPVTVAADECLHGVEDVNRRLDQGYGVITLKAAGKTLSMSLDMAVAAAARRIPCMVADSCCVPLLLGWNLNLAARLPSLPGMRCGLLESNGPDSYRNWDKMVRAHPCAGARWLEANNGYFELDDDFYASSAGILRLPHPYVERVSPQPDSA
jgi:L-alanine-DL-glutamate epimerase-like enolase superfamily enzyme